MDSLIFRTTSRLLMQIMLVFSIWILFRGHQLPGGGFIASLVAACALTQYRMATEHRVRTKPPFRWLPVLIASALLALTMGMMGWLHGRVFLSAVWISQSLGSPLLFDVAVYGVVLASVRMILNALEANQ